MKKTFLIIAMAVMFVVADAQIQTPAASPAGSVSSTIGLTEVKIEYFRPRLKGRKIFGEKDVMYPHGTMWRTGANSGTKISFSDDVKVENINVPKGEYLIFTWPGAGEWTVALYKDVSIGGNTDAYDASKDAAKFKVKTKKLAEKVETFTISIDDIAPDNKTGKVTLAWENTAVPFTITVDYDAKVMKAIEANTKVNPGNYFQAATYYLDNGKDLNKALEWINIAVESNPNAYWILHQKAKIQKALGDKKGAMQTATASLNSAKKENNQDYQNMNQELINSLK
ncbi:MAG: DUF2911 domain-containing protein [Cyclobacteriaceae bacterium]